MTSLVSVPHSPPVNIKTGEFNPEWLIWITSPNFLTLTVNKALGPASGGTGISGVPANNQLLVGNSLGTYSLASTIPTAALPAFSGDATSSAGTSALTLATVNANVGSWGSGTNVASFTVNAKGLIIAASNTAISGAPADFTVVSKFGCNGKSAQAAVSSGAAISTTASTNSAPYGYTTQAQADRIVALVNSIQSALIANGILT